MSVEKMLEKIRSFEEKELGKGSSLREILDAEKRLSMLFPLSYKAFLTAYGWACFGHLQVFGLGMDIPSYLDVVLNTLSEKNEMYPPLRDGLIAIVNDGAGNHYCLNTSAMEHLECPVVFWDHELGEDQELEYISPTFADWLIDRLNDQ